MTDIPEKLREKRDEYFKSQQLDANRCCRRCGTKWETCEATYAARIYSACYSEMKPLIDALEYIVERTSSQTRRYPIWKTARSALDKVLGEKR